MADLEEMANRIILLSKGTIAFDGSFNELREIEQSFAMYKFSYLGNAPELEGIKLKQSDGFNHEYIASSGNTKLFLEQISNIEGIENIEIQKVPIGDIISEIYRRKRVEL